jgi:hypothetical protein
MPRSGNSAESFIVLASSENMSESTRLGYGDVLDSPFDIALLKHFVFARETEVEGPQYDGDLARIRQAMLVLDAKQAHPMYFEELFAQAVVRELMSGPNRDSPEALGLMRIIRDLRPKLLLDSGFTGLEVLSRYDDPGLNSTTESMSLTLSRPQQAQPAALFFASQFFDKTGRRSKGLRLPERLADSEFQDERLTLDACPRLLLASGPDRLAISRLSSCQGQPSHQITQCHRSLRAREVPSITFSLAEDCDLNRAFGGASSRCPASRKIGRIFE